MNDYDSQVLIINRKAKEALNQNITHDAFFDSSLVISWLNDENPISGFTFCALRKETGNNNP